MPDDVFPRAYAAGPGGKVRNLIPVAMRKCATVVTFSFPERTSSKVSNPSGYNCRVCKFPLGKTTPDLQTLSSHYDKDFSVNALRQVHLYLHYAFIVSRITTKLLQCTLSFQMRGASGRVIFKISLICSTFVSYGSPKVPRGPWRCLEKLIFASIINRKHSHATNDIQYPNIT